ncbi:hypothetical protein HK101_011691 [Irineochytrium annulatum]|nr:hypothetical protein HK101_011691 [Irineochytrium annulatum]
MVHKHPPSQQADAAIKLRKAVIGAGVFLILTFLTLRKLHSLAFSPPSPVAVPAVADAPVPEKHASQAHSVAGDDEVNIPHLLCSPSPLSPPKIAACISGNARTFTYPLVHRTMKRFVFDAIGGEVTKFAYLKLEDVTLDPSFTEHSWNPPMPGQDEEEIGRVLQYLNVTAWKLDKGVTSPVKIQANPKCTFRAGAALSLDVPLKRALGQFTSLNECFTLVREHEKKHMVDHFNIMDRKYAGAVYDMLNWYKNDCKEEHSENDAESLLETMTIKYTGSPLQHYNFQLNVVREAGIPTRINHCHVLGGIISNVEACNMMFYTQQNRTL